ncbi:MAG: PfkB family carbohydrate kinase [Candidatus Berkiella sp.]
MTPQVWTIGGFDPSAGAGVLSDQHTFSALNINACAIQSVLTAQNGISLKSVQAICPKMIQDQFMSLKALGWPAVIKVGLVADATTFTLLKELLKDFPGTIIYDPVMVSSSGSRLMSQDAIAALKDWLKMVTILTPNIFEAQALIDHEIKAYQELPNAATQILNLGVKAVIMKGGHLQGVLAQDYCINDKRAFWLSAKRKNVHKTHGTGCVLSASLAAFIAKEYSFEDACVLAKMSLNQSLANACQYQRVGFAKLPKSPLCARDLPWLTTHYLQNHNASAFNPCQRIGVYPIIDDLSWIQKAALVHAPSLQLRIKSKSHQEVSFQIKEAVKGVSEKQQLFINDYWEQAIVHQAYGVHLGQEDLNSCDLATLREKGIRLGISTHSYSELARAVAIQPSYIAFGPIYSTKTKAMSFNPQGLNRLEQWRALVPGKLVAIGGINLRNIQDVVAKKVDGVAIVSAVTKALNPQQACKQLNDFMESHLHV